MKFRNIYKKALISVTGFGAMLLIGGSAMAQDSPRDEYEEWQSAKREVANELREYRRNPTRDNYRGWQDAIRDEKRERAEYQIAVRNNRGYAGNGRYGELNQESPRDEYEEWQSAVRELRNEEREYRNNPTRDNLRGVQDAKRDERREYAEYQAALRNSGVSRRVNW
jgi:hypothetical protein